MTTPAGPTCGRRPSERIGTEPKPGIGWTSTEPCPDPIHDDADNCAAMREVLWDFIDAGWSANKRGWWAKARIPLVAKAKAALSRDEDVPRIPTGDETMTVDNDLLAIIAKLHAREFRIAADMLKAGPGTPLLTAASDAADNAVDHVLAAAVRVAAAPNAEAGRIEILEPGESLPPDMPPDLLPPPLPLPPPPPTRPT